MSPEERFVVFARAFLDYCVRTHRILWQDYNRLTKGLAAREARVFGCRGKERFESYGQAMSVARARRHARDGHTHREAYPCANCAGYHLATCKPKERRAKKRLRLMKMERDFA